MNYAEQQRNPAKHALGIGIVIVMHLLLGWALVSGLARTVVEVFRAPIEARLIEEPRPSPPPEVTLPPPPKPAPPPPSFVPPPEVVIKLPQMPAPSITVTPVAPPPTPMTIAPPAPEAPPVPVASTAPSLDFNRCAKPEYNAAARRAETQGATVVAYTMEVDGRITDARVERSSGPTREHRMLDNLTLAAVKACKGRAGTIDGQPQRLTGRVEYVWKLTD